MTSRPETIYLVATPGGHLDLLLALRPAFEEYQRVWVVSPGASADALHADGEEVRVLPRFHGLTAGNLRLAMRSLGPAVRERPRMVVTAGSGSVVPFCAATRALGARVVFVETMARVHNPSESGRVLSRLASSVLVQWPEMLEVYPQARVGRPALLDQLTVARAPRSTGDGTFVAVGTHIDPFDRLLRVVDQAVGAGVLPGPAVAQTGVCSYRPRHMEAVAWMRPAEMDAAAERARRVVTHAGSGMIARALGAGLTPLVVPRKASEGEHVDDHQVQITEKLGQIGLVVPVDGDIRPEHLAAADAERPPMTRAFGDAPALADLVRREIERLSGAHA
ncbi:MAG TPA: glycosyltransferase [Solirubrobacteraceae bacterium]|nr:glycosyltransferase [Solirubrobacteraceae bacterium]